MAAAACAIIVMKLWTTYSVVVKCLLKQSISPGIIMWPDQMTKEEKKWSGCVDYG